jgi:predicted helicase
MSEILIRQYYSKVEKIVQYGGSRNESAVRSAFEELINAYCESKNLRLINELDYKTRYGTVVIPDGTVKDALRLDWGYWESKDQYDDLCKEIEEKFAKGYPDSNILFEDSQTAVLFQGGVKIKESPINDPEELDEILTKFLSYERPEVRTFREAVSKFKEDLPAILVRLREQIDSEALSNKSFKKAKTAFLELCKNVINPYITELDVREMIIQHVLTEDIFLTVFDESQFHRENNIARELQQTVNTFFTGDLRRNTLDSIKNYYAVIRHAAASIVNHHEKQKFLKALYENFYTAYNPKAADRLGIFYTPNEIVRFMIESTDYLLHKCFGKLLGDKGVEILDPAAGTGTFVAELIEYLPKAQLTHKYKHEIHCNEVSILPYYIANLNIEFTYKQKMGQYAEFKNICFMDTLDHAAFSKKQPDMFAMTVENTERIQKQNELEIFVIIGNPPYNANQQNENENNKNREYKEIDKRIKATYIKESTAQKTKLYDMYSRFFRWASDRIGDQEGIVAFITNSSFIDARTFDGFRKVVADEFDEIYLVDLGGNVRANPKLSGPKNNVFAIQAGVAISFMVKYKNRRDSALAKHKRNLEAAHQCRIYYYRRPELETAKEKLSFLATTKFDNVDFNHIEPDSHHNWINLSDNDFDELLSLANKETKSAKNQEDDKAVFKLFSLGVVTNRDEWVYDFSKEKLTEKMTYFFDSYESEMKRILDKDISDENLSKKIKWTRDLKKHVRRGIKLSLQKDKITSCFYRPYIKKQLYYDKSVNEMRYQMPIIFPNGKINENLIISINVANSKDFNIISSNCLVDLHFNGDSACLPLHRYENGNRIDNITDWGLKQFVSHYKNKKISKEDIFHYVYAVLHNPEYRRKYEQNLKRELPRIPFYDDFRKWVLWGKSLMNLHLNYETIEPYPLRRTDIEPTGHSRCTPKLKADMETGTIIIDSMTTLSGVPNTAWEYKLGTYSALQWILEQYKEKKIKDPTVAEKFNTYRFADYKEQVIDLLMRVCTVSVETMEIIREMEK